MSEPGRQIFEEAACFTEDDVMASIHYIDNIDLKYVAICKAVDPNDGFCVSAYLIIKDPNEPTWDNALQKKFVVYAPDLRRNSLTYAALRLVERALKFKFRDIEGD